MDKKSKNIFFDILPIILFVISAINLFICVFTGISSLIISVLIGIWTIIQFKKKDILYIICLGISIVSILIFVFVNIFGFFSVNNKMANSYIDEFVDSAVSAVTAANDDYILKKYKKTKCYTIDDINNLDNLNVKLIYSPSGYKYSDTSFIKVYKDENGVISSSICLTDINNNGFNYIDQSEINKDNLNIGAADICVIPNDCE